MKPLERNNLRFYWKGRWAAVNLELPGADWKGRQSQRWREIKSRGQHLISWIQLCLKPDHFSYIKIIFLKSVEAGFVSLVTERALSSIPSLSVGKDTATQEQAPHLALKHSARDLEKLPKLSEGMLWNGACASH